MSNHTRGTTTAWSPDIVKVTGTACNCANGCSACGGLECLCRPRFFSGQLLTDEDLNRLDHYMVAKNKLHNRYLHGWGVACGLKVSCHPCDGFVTVTSGYALSPCGDDIVVCRDEAVDMCGLVKKCRDDMRRQWDCNPAWSHQEPDCDQEQPWVLYICYQEKPSRGTMALRASSSPACCSRCSCGGSSSCGCGCHQKSDESKKNGCSPAAKRTPPQCEPTITCEGYTFQLRKMPLARQEKVDEKGMFNRIEECLGALAQITQAIESIANKPSSSVVKQIRDELLVVLERHGITNCDLHRRLLQPPEFVQELTTAQVRSFFGEFIIEAMRECLCSALMPPCPDPVADNCVPLATVTVNCEDGCRIQKICSWENRRMVPTVPAFEYWLEGFVTKPGLAEFLVGLCCDDPTRQNAFGVKVGPSTDIAGIPFDPSNPTVVLAKLKQKLKDILNNLFK